MSLLARIFLFKCIGKNDCFKVLKRRLPSYAVKNLDKLLTVRCRITRSTLRLKLLQQCIVNGVVPQYLIHKLRRCKYTFTSSVCQQVLRTEISSLRADIKSLRDEARRLVTALPSGVFNSFFVFSKYVNFSSYVLQKTRSSCEAQSIRILATSVSSIDGVAFPEDVDKHIINKSSYTLSLVEKQALCRGLKFSIPFRPKQEFIDCEFENFFLQLSSLESYNQDAVTKLKADLVSVSKDYRNWKPSRTLPPAHIDALKKLYKNLDIVICKPDKGNAVVILDRSDYDRKVSAILSDVTKFSVDSCCKDLTCKTEKSVIDQLQTLLKKGFIDKSCFQKLKPMGSVIPRLYGLPKIHKNDCPIRPILSMSGSPTHGLAQWLANVLQPVSDFVSEFCVPDSFAFANSIRNINLENLKMVSFDVVSLFTNVPIRKTVDIIRKLISDHDISLPIPTDLLCDLILLCVEHVQFAFNDQLYFQNDGIAMGSPLGPILSNIFVGYFEKYKLRPAIESLTVSYQRYVDDTFIIVKSSNDAQRLLSVFNSVHPNLQFTCEPETIDGTISFLDVLVSRNSDSTAVTSVYRKPTWSGLYTNFFSFVPVKYKSGLVRTLFDRARKICSVSSLPDEETLLFNTLRDNGYPEEFIEKHSKAPQVSDPVFGPMCKDVFLRLPFAGDTFSTTIRKRLFNSTKQAFPASNPRLIFTTKRIPVRPLKDPVPLRSKSHIIYKFKCDCGCSYVGRTDRTLGVRMKEHLPRWLLKNTSNRNTARSSICKHAAECDHFQGRDFLSYFSVLSRSSHPTSLRILEALFIKNLKPPLCVQKDFLYSLLLPW